MSTVTEAGDGAGGATLESGIHPTARCLDAGDDLRAALIRLCEDEAPREQIWSIAPVLRKGRASSKRARRSPPKD